jgi:site-specific DNA-methyltransferase (adenine-specific)
MKYQILHGDNRETLKTIADNSIDAIVTDPPYGIDFLGKDWDANTGALETYQECLRVLKPGGHILAFSAARTYHHLAITLEQAGFEIRDQIMWIYSSGFPKSQDIGKSIDRAAGKKDPNYGTNKASVVTTAEGRSESTYVRCKICNKGLNGNTANDCDKNPCGLKYAYQTEDGKIWSGWGTQLKPAHEPIALARKPIKLSIARNCQTHGVGALNIDACRVEVAEDEMESFQGNWDRVNAGMAEYAKLDGSVGHGAAQLVDQMKDISGYKPQGRFPSNVVGEIPLYQKYFYCPKVSRRERHIGCIDPGPMFERPRHEDGTVFGEGESMWMDPKVSGPKKIAEQPAGTNNHPTVKPIELMKYLIKLVTPPGGTVLDPFNGSGSTGCAAVELGMTYIGCELDPAYVEISLKRIAAWVKQDAADNNFEDLFSAA